MDDNLDYHDDRQQVTHDFVEGQVYVDMRREDDDADEYKEELTLIYIDDEIVVFRSEDEMERQAPGQHYHRQEMRSTFEKYVGSGRLRKIRDGDVKDPGVNLSEVKARAKRLRDYWRTAGGRKEDHKADAMQEFIDDQLEEIEEASGEEEVPFETISGIGDTTATRLRENGYRTARDIEAAKDGDLLKISGVGKTSVENIRNYISNT